MPSVKGAILLFQSETSSDFFTSTFPVFVSTTSADSPFSCAFPWRISPSWRRAV